MKIEVKKVNSEFKVVEKEDGVKFRISIDDSKITIFNKELIEDVIDTKFNKKYRKLLYMVVDIEENENSDESDAEIVLLKVEELKSLILTKYYKYLSKDVLNKYMKMILILEEKLRMPRRGRGR